LEDLAKRRKFQLGSFAKLILDGMEMFISLIPLMPPRFIKLNIVYPFNSPVFSSWLSNKSSPISSK
ncbi:MAG: hypothetical protein AABX96_01455, partial [Nanoarchaeota archaeon]